jgi:hypothetical protein
MTEVAGHGVQGDPATAQPADSSTSAFETAEQLYVPAINEVADTAWDVIHRIMSKGSDKSVFGQWFHTDSRRYNADRCINHICQAMMQLDGNRPAKDANGEDAMDHLERAMVRAAFLLFKTKKGKIE